MSTVPTAPRFGTTRSWSVPQGATDRELVVLIENGGVDLGIPALIDTVLGSVPGAGSLVSEANRRAITEWVGQELRRVTDAALESAELALQQFHQASPDPYGAVTLLRDSTASLAELRRALFDATRAGRVVDLMILTHGNADVIALTSNISGQQIRSLRTEYGGPLNIRSVYMMNCVGSSLNPAWLEAGARTSAGSHGNNYLPEPTTHLFWSAWRDGASFDSAVTGAYRQTITMLNSLLRTAVATVLGPVAGAFAQAIDLAGLDTVQQSRPEVVGHGALTVTSDTLPAVAAPQALVTTVLPGLGAYGALARATGVVRAASAAGREFIAGWERPYLAPGSDGEAALGRRITAAEGFLANHIARPLEQHQIDALLSFACGIGAESLRHSAVLRLLEDGALEKVPAEMLRWVRVRVPEGVRESEILRARRTAEAELFAGTPFATPFSAEVRHYSFQQNPAAAVGIGLAIDAISMGLGAAAVGQTALQASAGTLTVTYDAQARLLTPEAKLEMPGANSPRRKYRKLLYRFPQARVGTASAEIMVDWGGNDYGEIETPVIEPDLESTSTWSQSSALFRATAIRQIQEGNDPRLWPLCYHFQAAYDPVGVGHWEFQGEFEVNAFGGLRFTRNEIKSQSLYELGRFDPEHWRGPDHTPPIPPLPAEQLEYLRANVPQ